MNQKQKAELIMTRGAETKRWNVRAYVFGHLATAWDDGTWTFDDTGELYDYRATLDRECPKCGMRRTAEGHDPCLGTLPGVCNACCGHGVKEGYISFENGIVVRGDNFQVKKWSPEE